MRLMVPLKALCVLSLAILVWGCGAKTVDNTVPQTCIDSIDCPVGYVCADGTCRQKQDGLCTVSDECPEGYTCLEDGTCQAEVECQQDADCCPPERANCAFLCEAFQCKGTECNAGQTKSCYVGCHQGKRTCGNGLWGACDAAIVMPETCDDNVDNDCNGKTDEGCPVCTPGATEACAGPCEDGSRTCDASGQWGECIASTDCLCEPGQGSSQGCGKCGTKEAECGADGKWSWSIICTGEGACDVGTEEFQPCGMCGQQMRACSANCVWNDWSSCKAEGACVPSDTEAAGCGLCGEKVRECQNNCTWGEYGACVDGGGCTAGETQEQACGNCGVKVSTCGSNCQWSDFGACQNAGPCAPGEVDTEPCGVGNCGARTRACLDSCEWGDWTDCEGAGVCVPGSQEEGSCGPDSEEGVCDFGKRVHTCNLSCQWNPWGNCLGATFPQTEVCGNGVDEDCDGQDKTNPDDYEPNNTCGECYWLGQDPEETLYPTIDNTWDQEDYFCFKGNDGASFLGPELITVKAQDLPVGMDVDLFLYQGLKDCEAGIGKAIAKSQNIGGDDESLVWAEGFATSDDAVYYVQVSNYGESFCYLPYKLFIKGLK